MEDMKDLIDDGTGRNFSKKLEKEIQFNLNVEKTLNIDSAFVLLPLNDSAKDFFLGYLSVVTKAKADTEEKINPYDLMMAADEGGIYLGVIDSVFSNADDVFEKAKELRSHIDHTGRRIDAILIF